MKGFFIEFIEVELVFFFCVWIMKVVLNDLMFGFGRFIFKFFFGIFEMVFLVWSVFIGVLERNGIFFWLENNISGDLG